MGLYNINVNSFVFLIDKLLLALPVAFLVVAALNFGLDSLFLCISMIIFKIENKKHIYKQYIIKIFGAGLFVDLIVFIIMIFLSYYDIYEVEEALITIPVFIISMLVAFIFNYFITFKTAPNETPKNELKVFKSHFITFRNEQKEATKNEPQNSKNGYKKSRIVFSCIFAVATAPWSFVLPLECTEWFYILLIKYFNFY